MGDERKMILQMVEEGKITAEEGIKLLEAFEGTSSSASEGPQNTTDSQGAQDSHDSKSHKGSQNYQSSDSSQRSKKDDFGFDEFAKGIGEKAEKFTKEFVHQGKNVTNKLSDMVEKFITKVKDLDFDFDFDFPIGNTVRVERVYAGIAPEQGEIELTTVNGRIEVRGWDRSEFRIEVKAVIKAENETEGKAILSEILHMDSDEEKINLVVDRRRGTKISLIVYLPKNLTSELNLITSNGSIELEDIHLQEARMETNNGAITFDSCWGDNIFCITSNGKINMERTTFNELYAKSSNGMIRIDGIVRKGKVRTSNGGIRYVLREAAEGYLDLKTTNGSIEARLPSKGMEIQGEISTTFGHLECTLPEVEVVYSTKEITNRNLRFKSTQHYEKSYDIVCKTSNGTIRIHELD